MATAKRKWTFMAYIAGDNNLDPEGLIDLNEMKAVGSTNDVAMVAQYDRATGHESKRYFLRSGTSVAADVVAELGNVNTGDPARLSEFIAWAVKEYPADHYHLDMWNHGAGWDDTDIYAEERSLTLRALIRGRSRIRRALFNTMVRRKLQAAQTVEEAKAILLDDNAKDFLDCGELRQVLLGAKKLLNRNIDIVSMDACLMSMAEIGYQLRGTTDYLVASEEVEPGAGYCYNLILDELAKNPAMAARDLATLIVERYVDSYPRESVTQSACDITKIESLAGSLKGLAATLRDAVEAGAIAVELPWVQRKVQRYAVPDNVDLVDLCSLFALSCDHTAVAERCREVIQVCKSDVVVASRYKGAGLKNSNGVAIYFPMTRVSPLYRDLDWSAETGWNGFLEAYLAETDRREWPGRPQPSAP